MSAVERIEKNKVKLTFEVAPERFREGLQYAYQKNKHLITIPGFRKGKAPRKVIERSYGKDFFYEEAFKHILPDVYEQSVDAHGIEPVYMPDIKLVEADEAKGAVFTAEVYVKPEVEIDGYYGLTYPRFDTEPSDSDIQNRIQAEREKNTRLISTEEPARKGDILTINFEGRIDGEPFENGTAKDQEITLGSHTFIEGFEDQLIGAKAGDDITIQVTFPADYNHAELAGKEAACDVEVLDVKIKEYPEIDDDFAQDVSDFETLAEYRESLAEAIRKDKEREADMRKRSHVMAQLVEKAVMDVPDVMIKARTDELMEDLKYRLQLQGMTLDLYLRYTQTTEEAIRENYAQTARENVFGSLALAAVAAKEQLEVSEDDYREYLEKQAAQFMVSYEKLAEQITPERKKDINLEILNRKALDFVLEKAVAVDQEMTNP